MNETPTNRRGEAEAGRVLPGLPGLPTAVIKNGANVVVHQDPCFQEWNELDSHRHVDIEHVQIPQEYFDKVNQGGRRMSVSLQTQ